MPEVSQAQQRELEARAAAVEARTGVQVVVAVAGKSEAYPEVPWKAFALGASLSTLPAVAFILGGSSGNAAPRSLLILAAVLSTGIIASLLAMAVPTIGRCLVGGGRLETEVRQHAESLFLGHELFATRGRRGVLILASLYERRLMILPDTGLGGLLGTGELRRILDRALPLLANGRPAEALLAALDSLETVLLERGCQGLAGAPDEIPPEFLREKGP